MTQLLPNIFAVEVPEDATNFRLDIWFKGQTNISYSSGGKLFGGEYLPPGSYEILFTTKDCTEDDASSVRNAVVDAHFDTELQEWRYGFHENNTMIYETATDALQSLLRSHGLSTDKNYLLLKKIS